MQLFRGAIAAAIFGVAFAGRPYNQKCKYDRCLASAVIAQKGLSQCSTYFKTTITPSAVTSTSTAVVTTTIESTTSSTTSSTSTISETSTEYDQVTSTTTTTTTATATTTEIDTVSTTTSTTTTSTSTVTVIPTNAGNGDTGLRKRGWPNGNKGQGRAKCHYPKAPPFNACSTVKNGYSSVCSCIGATTSTSILPTPTEVQTTTSTSSSTSVVTVISTTVISVTTTSTVTDYQMDIATSTDTETTTSTQTTSVTTTATITSTRTVTTTAIPTPTCTLINSSNGGFEYGNQYSGSNTLNPNNAGNTAGSGGGQTQTYSGTLDVCSAAQQCANFASTAKTPLGNSLFTFNLYFTEDAQNWRCVGYYDSAEAEDYNVVDPNVRYSYGWTAQ